MSYTQLPDNPPSYASPGVRLIGCGECQQAIATMNCAQCSTDFCATCSSKVHGSSKVLSTHKITPLTSSTASVAPATSAPSSFQVQPAPSSFQVQPVHVIQTPVNVHQPAGPGAGYGTMDPGLQHQQMMERQMLMNQQMMMHQSSMASMSAKGQSGPTIVNNNVGSGGPFYPAQVVVVHDAGVDHCCHWLLCMFTAGIWAPFWLGACCGCCCQRPCN